MGGRARAGERGRAAAASRCQGQRQVVKSSVSVRGQFNLPPMAFIALAITVQ